jgi:hypothetical protein
MTMNLSSTSNQNGVPSETASAVEEPAGKVADDDPGHARRATARVTRRRALRPGLLAPAHREPERRQARVSVPDVDALAVLVAGDGLRLGDHSPAERLVLRQ